MNTTNSTAKQMPLPSSTIHGVWYRGHTILKSKSPFGGYHWYRHEVGETENNCATIEECKEEIDEAIARRS